MLSAKEKALMIAFINELNGMERLNLCEECHTQHYCGHDHNILLYGQGTCSICGKAGKIVNCAIANKVVQEGIDIMDYWRDGKKIV